jgi:hypothetical protein
MDVMTSRGGTYFSTTREDASTDQATTFLPPRKTGDWNGGLISTMMGGGRRIGRFYYTVVHLVTNLPHFATSLLEQGTSSCNATALRERSARQYWAPVSCSYQTAPAFDAVE